MSPDNTQVQDNKPSDKEINFRAQEQKYERLLAQERQARLEAEKAAQEARKAPSHANDDDDDTDEPYVDHKKLNKKLAKAGQQFKEEAQTEIQKAVKSAIAEERKTAWIKQNPDFYETLKVADKLFDYDPELADSMLTIPNEFERQKAVYKNIKHMGLDKPKAKEQSIQEKIDANRRSPYYQPSSVGTAPYGMQGDFSSGGQKAAYDKMQELKSKLRI